MPTERKIERKKDKTKRQKDKTKSQKDKTKRQKARKIKQEDRETEEQWSIKTFLFSVNMRALGNSTKTIKGINN